MSLHAFLAALLPLFLGVLGISAYAQPALHDPPSASTTPAVAVVASSTPARIPILVYHIVRPAYESDSKAVREERVTPEIFDAELAHLRDAGYSVITFRDLEAYVASSTPLPQKPVILSVDDAWRDQFTYAFPVLEKYHDPATFFVFTNAIGRPGFLTWDDLRTLIAAGMAIGDHTRSHPFLTKIDPAKLTDEIMGSKQILENKLGVSITEFAYPFGQYNPAIVAVVKDAGYKSARGDYWTNKPVSADTLYTLSALNAPTTTAAFDRYFP